MEHRIRVCVAAIGLATIGHQAQAGVSNFGASAQNTSSGFLWDLAIETDSAGINAIGIERVPRVVVDVPNVFDIDRPSSPIPFDDPFTSISDPSWSNVGSDPEPERAAVAGNNFISDDSNDELNVDIEFGPVGSEDAFAFTIFFFEEGEETSQDTGGDLIIFNIFPREGDDSNASFITTPSDIANTTRTRADFGMSVIPMPHPAGMACVGLAGVAMVRRRRSV